MSYTIMIVDDMKINIDILAENLSDKYVIMPAISGEIAMKMLDRRKPDLVLLDVFMQGADGFDVLKFMKSRDDLSHIPVIFVTGEKDSKVEEKGFALGAADYVRKPFNPAVIKAKVRTQLELKEYRGSLQAMGGQGINSATSFEAFISGLSLLSEIRDDAAEKHILRIKEYIRIIGGKMLKATPGLITQKLANQVVYLSPLHDIGKSCVPDEIIGKSEIFTEKEIEIMRSHTVEGAEMLRRIASFLEESIDASDLKVAMEIVELHHEKFDGSGYPYGLKGEAIPFSARIVTLADVYDGLRSERPYKKAHNHDEAINIMFSDQARTKAAHFDPQLLKIFKDNHLEIKHIFDTNV